MFDTSVPHQGDLLQHFGIRDQEGAFWPKEIQQSKAASVARWTFPCKDETSPRCSRIAWRQSPFAIAPLLRNCSCALKGGPPLCPWHVVFGCLIARLWHHLSKCRNCMLVHFMAAWACFPRCFQRQGKGKGEGACHLCRRQQCLRNMLSHSYCIHARDCSPCEPNARALGTV